MKTRITLFLLCFFALAGLHAQTFVSIKDYEGECAAPPSDYDMMGNRYVFQGGLQMSFLSKYNSEDALLWKIPTGIRNLKSMKVEAEGNVVLVGTTAQSIELTIMKVGTSGSILWNTLTQHREEQYWSRIDPNEVMIDGTGNIYVVGYLEGAYRIGAHILMSRDIDTTALPSFPYSYSEPFFLKCSATGEIQWAQIFPDESFIYDQFLSMQTDAAGNIILLGNIEYYQDVWMGKFASTGERLWLFRTERVHPKYNFIFAGFTLEPQGNIYLHGVINGDYKIGNDTLDCKHIEYDEWSAEANSEIFIAKLNINGQPLWTKQTDTRAGTYFTGGTSCNLDQEGNIYLAGEFEARTTIGNTTLIAMNPLESFNTDVFLAKLTPNGDMQWVTAGGGQYPDYNGGICLDEEGNGNLRGFGYQTIFGNLEHPGDFYVKIAPPSATTNYLYRVNCGGPLLQDEEMDWAEDRQLAPSSYLDPASSNHATGTWHAWDKVNTTGVPDKLFGTNRYDVPAGGDLSYKFPLPQGLYKVNLYFSEKPFGVNAPGQRVFGVKLDGREAMEGYDIFKSAGLNADKKTFILTVTDGMFEVDLIREIGNPQINGIEIISLNLLNNDSAAEIIPQEPVAAAKFRVAHPVNESVLISTMVEETLPLAIYIYDRMGRVLYQGNHNSSDGKVEISTAAFAENLTPGMYLIKVNEETLKFIKE